MNYRNSYMDIDQLIQSIQSGTMTQQVRAGSEGLVPRPKKETKPRPNPLAGLVDYTATMRKDAEDYTTNLTAAAARQERNEPTEATPTEAPKEGSFVGRRQKSEGTAIRGGDPLEGVNADLVRVMKRAAEISKQPFKVVEGVRGKERQAGLVKKGASKTMNSRHLVGNAIDIAPTVDGQVSWDWKYYDEVARAMKQAAKELDVNVEWGGDWKTFKDGPHWQIAQK